MSASFKEFYDEHDGFTNILFRYVMRDFPHAVELTALAMALQGCLTVKNGMNKDNKMHWFHAFALSMVMAFAGGMFGFFWMGKVSPMVSSGDINVGACIIAFVLVNYVPYGHRICSSLPATIAIVSVGSLFKTNGLTGFIMTSYDAHEATHNGKYYPIPVLGPIFYGTMLGNMNGFVMKGINTYLENGIPWPMQNGLFAGTFFHFYAHDRTGPVGIALRAIVDATGLNAGFEDEDRIFGRLVVSVFMQITGFLRIKSFLGPSFSPFNVLPYLFPSKGFDYLTMKSSRKINIERDLAKKNQTQINNNDSKKKKQKKGNKNDSNKKNK